jgi:hypothetical protein
VGATKREQLELLVKNIQTLNETCKQAGRITATDKAKMDEMWMESRALKAQLDVDDLAAPTNNNYHGLSFNALGEPPPEGFRPKSVGATTTKSFGVDRPEVGDAPPVAFSDEQIRQLHDAVVSGKSIRIDSKAAVLSGDVPMSTVPSYRMGPLAWRREPTRVANLLRSSSTEASEVDYFRITTPATASAPVAEGAAKPESTLVYDKVEAPMVKIASWIEVSDETLSDFAGFRQSIQEELLADLVRAENAQLLLGTGTPPAMTGMMATSGVLTRAMGADTALDAMWKAIVDLRVGTSFAEADGVVLHPNDWSGMVTAKDTTGTYILGDPMAGTRPSLWGLPVTLTTQITEGTALIGSFKEAAEMFVRWAPRIEVANQGAEQFKNNTTLIRCEERIGLAVYRPTALIKVTGI